MADAERQLINTHNTITYYLRDRLVADGWLVSGTLSGIATLMTAFPTDEDVSRIVTRENAKGTSKELVLPVVAVGVNNYIKRPTGIGGDDDESHNQILVMIFAEDDAQRKLMGQQLYNNLHEVDTELLDYTGGFPPNVVPSGYGAVYFENVVMSPFRVPGSPNVADRHRANIAFDAVVYEST